MRAEAIRIVHQAIERSINFLDKLLGLQRRRQRTPAWARLSPTAVAPKFFS